MVFKIIFWIYWLSCFIYLLYVQRNVEIPPQWTTSKFSRFMCKFLESVFYFVFGGLLIAIVFVWKHVEQWNKERRENDV